MVCSFSSTVARICSSFCALSVRSASSFCLDGRAHGLEAPLVRLRELTQLVAEARERRAELGARALRGRRLLGAGVREVLPHVALEVGRLRGQDVEARLELGRLAHGAVARRDERRQPSERKRHEPGNGDERDEHDDDHQ